MQGSQGIQGVNPVVEIGYVVFCGEEVWIHGTQSWEEKITRIQEELAVDRATAAWKLGEQSRSGYWQVEKVTGPDGEREIKTNITSQNIKVIGEQGLSPERHL